MTKFNSLRKNFELSSEKNLKLNSTGKEAVIAVEPRDHAKNNGVSPKDHMSRGNRQIMNCLIILFTSILFLSTCSSYASFVKGDGGRTSVQISDRISYNLAFDEAISILTRKFELEMISKEAGYIKTKWVTTWVGKWGAKPQKDYRVRITLRMSEERKRIDIHAEAQKLKGKYWIGGYDTQLLEDIRKDISGVVGY